MPPEDEVKPLTPEDVGNKRFTPVRLREGYDMGEVDQFLDQVEAELQRLIAESDDLRAKLAAAQGGHGGAVAAATPGEKADDQTGSAAAAPRETIKVVTPAEASSAAVRLLELATRNADEVVAEAREEAEQIVVGARTEAETTEQGARTRAQNLDSETETKRTELFGDLEKERIRLDAEVDTLRAFEREYRSRLKSYFTEQLAALDGIEQVGDLPASEDEGAPKRLKSILGGEASGPDGDAATDGPADLQSDESPSGETPRG